MTKLYKHKTKNHIVRLLDTPLEYTDNTPDNQVDGLLKYAYCQRQEWNYPPLDTMDGYWSANLTFKPFLMEWDRFQKLYEDIK